MNSYVIEKFHAIFELGTWNYENFRHLITVVYHRHRFCNTLNTTLIPTVCFRFFKKRLIDFFKINLLLTT